MNLGGCGQTPKDSGTVTAKDRGEEANLDPSEEDPETSGSSPQAQLEKRLRQLLSILVDFSFLGQTE